MNRTQQHDACYQRDCLPSTVTDEFHAQSFEERRDVSGELEISRVRTYRRQGSIELTFLPAAKPTGLVEANSS